MSYQTRNFNTQQSGNTKPIWSAAGIRQMPIDPFIDGKVSNGSILFWDRGNQYWTVVDKNVKRLTCYGQYLIWDGTTWIIVGDENVKLGCQSGKFNQGSYSVAIGNDAGYCNQNSNSVAIGLRAGYSNQGEFSVALGSCSGETKQGNFAVSIGYGAGSFTQNDYAISIGNFAGITKQGANSISIGRLAGAGTQNDECIAIGYQSGYSLQGTGAIALGQNSGKLNQGERSISLGENAGEDSQGNYSFASGVRAGNTTQGISSIALGYYSGELDQGNSSISIGSFAGRQTQGDLAIAIGYAAGNVSQGDTAISIGKEAGFFSQGANSIAIGPLAGYTGQHPNTIILSATGGALNSDKTGALFVNPIALRGTGTNEVLYYDSGNSEVFRGPQGFQNYASGFFSNFINTSTGPTGSGPYSGPFVSPFDIITTERVIYNNIANNFIIQKTGKYLINWTVQAGLEPNPSTDFGYIDFYLRVNGFQTLPTLVIQLQSSSAMIRSGANTCILSLNSGDYLDIWTSVFTGPAGWIFATSITIQQL